MADDFRGRFKIAWKAYVRARLDAEPELAPEDILDKDVAAEVQSYLVGEKFTAQTFSKVKSGKQKPGGAQLAALAIVLGADYFWLAGLRPLGGKEGQQQGFPARDEAPKVDLSTKGKRGRSA